MRRVRGALAAVFFMKQQMDAPDSGNRHKHKNHTAARGELPAENPTYNIKTEKADGTPVQTAYNRNRQSDFIKYGLH